MNTVFKGEVPYYVICKLSGNSTSHFHKVNFNYFVVWFLDLEYVKVTLNEKTK